ncbi:hypothetical protein J6590_080306 [Homalodisca vitripennis]|nr:hypothetical protein J6590_080306 [Homalodisca vitripennis]
MPSPRSITECTEYEISHKNLRSPRPSIVLRKIIIECEENINVDEELECKVMSKPKKLHQRPTLIQRPTNLANFSISAQEISPNNLKFIYDKRNRKVVTVSVVTPEDISSSAQSRVETLHSTSTKHVPTVNNEPLDTGKDPNENDKIMLQDEAFKNPHPEGSQSRKIKLPNSQEFRELESTDTGLESTQQILTEMDNNIKIFSDRDECFSEFLENFFTVFEGSVELICKEMADLLYLVITES